MEEQNKTILGKRVVILDDCEDDLKVFKDVVAELNCKAVITTSFHDAYALCDKGEVDILISDLNVGDESGFTLVEAVHKISPNGEIMKIICSSQSPADYLESIKKFDVVGWIVKPANYESVLKVLGKILA